MRTRVRRLSESGQSITPTTSPTMANADDSAQKSGNQRSRIHGVVALLIVAAIMGAATFIYVRQRRLTAAEAATLGGAVTLGGVEQSTSGASGAGNFVQPTYVADAVLAPSETDGSTAVGGWRLATFRERGGLRIAAVGITFAVPPATPGLAALLGAALGGCGGVSVEVVAAPDDADVVVVGPTVSNSQVRYKYFVVACLSRCIFLTSYHPRCPSRRLASLRMHTATAPSCCASRMLLMCRRCQRPCSESAGLSSKASPTAPSS